VGPSVALRTGISCIWVAAATLVALPAHALSFDGEVSYTSDYILRGISATGGRGAGQIDLRLSTRGGSFAGVFASTLNRLWTHTWGAATGWDYELESYAGHRFDFSPSWSTTVTGTYYSYLKGNTPFSDDYQEISLTTSYLDQWTLDVAVIPNAVRFEEGYRLGRYPAYVVSASALIPLVGRLALAAGAGYYTSDQAGYAYGNVGLTFELKNWRLDAGYYVAQNRAAQLFPYGRAGSRFAGTVSWHF
jgi:uncharacterized protein (TIGR02001 family)